MRRALAVAAVVVVLATGCATGVMWLTDHPVVDEYATAKVRIYHAGKDCRVEVTTPTATIVTMVTRCLVVPVRSTP